MLAIGYIDKVTPRDVSHRTLAARWQYKPSAPDSDILFSTGLAEEQGNTLLMKSLYSF